MPEIITLKKIFEAAVKAGMDTDPRGSALVTRELEETKK